MTPEIIPQEAFEAGTVNRPDRAAQYKAAVHKTPEKLLEAVNATGAVARSAKAQADWLQHKMNLKLRNEIIVALTAALLARAPEIYAWVIRITQ